MQCVKFRVTIRDAYMFVPKVNAYFFSSAAMKASLRAEWGKGVYLSIVIKITLHSSLFSDYELTLPP